MKYVQAGIFACLIVIAGLLFGIYHAQHSQQVEPAAQAQPATLAESSPPRTPEAAQQAAQPLDTKPSPLPPPKPAHRARTAAKAAPVSPQPPAAEPAASVEPVGVAERLPPAVIEPVIPNEPPLAQTPAAEASAPPQPRTVTVPENTEIIVRMINTLSTNRNLPGDRFEATLDKPLVVDGWLVAAKGDRVEGRVLDAKQAGRLKGVAELSFDLVRLTTAAGPTVDIVTSPQNQTGDESHGEDLKKVGLGAGIGAVIGAIAGGGKGAAIGAGAGAGAGAGTVLATRGKTVVVPTETRLSFRLRQPLEVTAAKPVSL